MIGLDGEYQVLGIIASAVVAIVAIIAVFTPIILLTVAFLRRGTRHRVTRDEEVRQIQEIHQGLSKMENRIEALETILFDRRKKTL